MEQLPSLTSIYDAVAVTRDGRSYMVLLLPDSMSHVRDADCYSVRDVANFNRGMWVYVGVVVQDITGREASVWAVEYGRMESVRITTADIIARDDIVGALITEIESQR